MQLTSREIDALAKADQRRRTTQLQRDHALDLMLTAGVPLHEALTLVDSKEF
jgi:hypothetical protein